MLECVINFSNLPCSNLNSPSPTGLHSSLSISANGKSILLVAQAQNLEFVCFSFPPQIFQEASASGPYYSLCRKFLTSIIYRVLSLASFGLCSKFTLLEKAFPTTWYSKWNTLTLFSLLWFPVLWTTWHAIHLFIFIYLWSLVSTYMFQKSRVSTFFIAISMPSLKQCLTYKRCPHILVEWIHFSGEGGCSRRVVERVNWDSLALSTREILAEVQKEPLFWIESSEKGSGLYFPHFIALLIPKRRGSAGRHHHVLLRLNEWPCSQPFGYCSPEGRGI